MSSINEQVISEFYRACQQRGRLALYVDFIAYYCTHARVNYEKYAKMYLENVLVLMNDADERLVDKVARGFAAIVNGLQKESQFTLVPIVRYCIEQLAVTRIGDALYKKRVPFLRLLEKPEGVKNISAVI